MKSESAITDLALSAELVLWRLLAKYCGPSCDLGGAYFIPFNVQLFEIE